MIFSKLTDGLTKNIFSVLDDKKNELLAAGKEVFNLSVGTPDFKPDRFVMDEFCARADIPENYRYSLQDMPELTEAVIEWYARRFGVLLEREEITSCYGSQEGIAHVASALCNPGDTVLVPDPGYPIFSFGAQMAGAQLAFTPLTEDHGFLVDFDSIDPALADRAKMIVVSYPANPVTAVAGPEFYERLVHFAKKHDLFVVHDNAYCELTYDGFVGGSFLQTKGAKDVGIEFNSLSKSYNLTGMRVSFALGNRDMIARFRLLRSQIDYGLFYPVQYAAIAALTGPQDILARNRAGYQARRDALCGGFRSIGWDMKDSPATMFTWAKIPKGYASSFDFVYRMMDATGLICTPGSAFGQRGEGYVRFALVQPVAEIQRMIARVDRSGILKG